MSLTYAGQAGHAMIDRELYLLRCWADNPARSVAAGVPAQWAAGDEVYGADPGLRVDLEARQVG